MYQNGLNRPSKASIGVIVGIMVVVAVVILLILKIWGMAGFALFEVLFGIAWLCLIGTWAWRLRSAGPLLLDLGRRPVWQHLAGVGLLCVVEALFFLAMKQQLSQDFLFLSVGCSFVMMGLCRVRLCVSGIAVFPRLIPWRNVESYWIGESTFTVTIRTAFGLPALPMTLPLPPGAESRAELQRLLARCTERHTNVAAK